MNWAETIDYGSVLLCGIGVICLGYFSYKSEPKKKSRLLLAGWAVVVITVVRIIFALAGAQPHQPAEKPGEIYARVLKAGKLAPFEEECASPRGFQITIPGGYRYLLLADNPDNYLMAIGPNQELLFVGSESAGHSNEEALGMMKQKWLKLQPTVQFGPEVIRPLQHDRRAIRIPFSYTIAGNKFSGIIILVPVTGRALALVVIGPDSYARFNDSVFAQAELSLQLGYAVKLD